MKLNKHVAEPLAASLNGFAAAVTRPVPKLALCEFCGQRPAVMVDPSPLSSDPRHFLSCLECTQICSECGRSENKHHDRCALNPERMAEDALVEEESDPAWERGFERGFDEAKEAKI